MDGSPTILDELTLDDVETIRVFADERRLQIIKMMRTPTTVKAIAQAIDLSPSKLYYHVNLLLEHGLIQVVGQNTETGIVEKIYQVTAHRYRLVNPLVAGEQIPEEAAAALFSSMLAETRTNFLQALAMRDPAEGTPPRHPFLSQKEIRLTEEELTTLHQKFVSLIQEVTTLSERNHQQDLPAYTLTLVFHRQPEES